MEIIVPHEKNIIVGCVCRPLNQNTTKFIDKFNNIVSLISTDNIHCYVIEDFNLDPLHYNHHVPTQEFIDSSFLHTFLPLISNPTRRTSYSATVFDNIFTNNLAHCALSSIIPNDLSGHLPVFSYFKDAILARSSERKFVICTFNNNYLHKFNETLSNAKWSSFYNIEDPKEAYNDLTDDYSRIYNACFPLMVLKGKQVNKFFSPWLSPGLLKSVNKKNRPYKKFVISLSTSSETKYKAYKNKLIHLIRIAKQIYNDSKFENARNDLKTTWKLSNEVINKRKNKSSLPTSFKSEGNTLTDPVEIANRFCKYFINIGPNLARSTPSVNPSFRSYLSDNNHPSSDLKPTTTGVLESICGMFALKKAPGYDSIPMHVINHSLHLISTPLADIINISLLKAIFPHKLKIAKIILIYKAEDPSFFVKYGPISLLSNYSNFFLKK